MLARLPRALGHLYTLLVVVIGWVLFRSESFAQAQSMLASMVSVAPPTFEQIQFLMQQLSPMSVSSLICGLVFALPVKPLLQKHLLTEGVPMTATSMVCALVLLVVCVLELSAGGYNPFIYFRF